MYCNGVDVLNKWRPVSVTVSWVRSLQCARIAVFHESDVHSRLHGLEACTDARIVWDACMTWLN